MLQTWGYWEKHIFPRRMFWVKVSEPVKHSRTFASNGLKWDWKRKSFVWIFLNDIEYERNCMKRCEKSTWIVKRIIVEYRDMITIEHRFFEKSGSECCGQKFQSQRRERPKYIQASWKDILMYKECTQTDSITDNSVHCFHAYSDNTL